jgi:hypothetical protein
MAFVSAEHRWNLLEGGRPEDQEGDGVLEVCLDQVSYAAGKWLECLLDQWCILFRMVATSLYKIQLERFELIYVCVRFVVLEDFIARFYEYFLCFLQLVLLDLITPVICDV